MTPRNRFSSLLGAAAAALMAAAPLQGATLFWQGGTDLLTAANYTGASPNVAPATGDLINFGNGGTGTYSAGTLSLARLRVGHDQSTPAPGGAGAGTVTINNGAVVNLTGGAAGANNAGLTVGQTQNGTLNIDGAGSSVTSSRLIVVGLGNNTGRSGTINITNGGSLVSTVGNINLGDSTAATPNGVQGHLFVDGNVTANSSGADLLIGMYSARSSFAQTSGNVQINDTIEVGAENSRAVNVGTSFSISGGATTHGGNFFVGRGASTDATVNISGTGVINTGGRFLMGGNRYITVSGQQVLDGTATGVTVNHSGGTLNTTLDLRVADSSAVLTGDSTYNLSGTGVINSTTGGIVGRQGTGQFLQTGGTANFNGSLAIGNRETGTNATNGLYKISAGVLNAAAALNIAPNGTGELRVVGDDATITVGANMLVGNTANGVGTLAFELEAGDLLSTIGVTGVATFSAGSVLTLDAANAMPTQTVYDLLTASSIVDNGISFAGPANWTYQIVSGGNGQILQAVLAIPEPGTLGLALVAGICIVRRRR